MKYTYLHQSPQDIFTRCIIESILFFNSTYFFSLFISDLYSDGGDSFHPSMWEEEREQRCRIHFDFEEADVQGVS